MEHTYFNLMEWVLFKKSLLVPIQMHLKNIVIVP